MRAFGIALCFVLGCSARAEVIDDLTPWLASRLSSSRALLDRNISPSGAQRGFVLAAPWSVPGVQNYQYHWVRDAALVMNTYVDDANGFARLADYANFSRANQLAPNDDGVGLGEVKFNPDGSRFTAWMRPQNDGPALRAITIMRWMAVLSRTNHADLARHLFDGTFASVDGVTAPALVETDLDYVATHYNDAGYDLWEEVKAHHFYTRLVQRKALQDGARIADVYGDANRARAYRAAAAQIQAQIDTHWLPIGTRTPFGGVSPGQIWDSYDREWGTDYKSTGLDVAAVLGALHAHNELDQPGDRYFSASDDRVLKTAWELARAFAADFPIANTRETAGLPLGTPIGRYPLDRYNGYVSTSQGNPWFLATAAFAELYYRATEEWRAQGFIQITPIDVDFFASLANVAAGETIRGDDPRFSGIIANTKALADSYLRRVKLHENNGRLTEQYYRNDGYETGAMDLSWSYASLLTAARHR